MRVFIALTLIFFFSSQAQALTKEKYETKTVTVTGTVDMGTMVLDSPSRSLKDLAEKYVDVPKGALDWKLLGATKERIVEGKDKDGYDFQYYKPGFTKEVEALDGKEVIIKGFMFPLGAADKQKSFLLGPFPVGCPFHYHVAPALVLEVHADDDAPINFSYDPVVLKGKLQLIRKDQENSPFYRLEGARLVE